MVAFDVIMFYLSLQTLFRDEEKSMITITRLSLTPEHHFYGYYGIEAWDPSLRYHLSLETDFHEHRPIVEDVASVRTVMRVFRRTEIGLYVMRIRKIRNVWRN